MSLALAPAVDGEDGGCRLLRQTRLQPIMDMLAEKNSESGTVADMVKKNREARPRNPPGVHSLGLGQGLIGAPTKGSMGEFPLYLFLFCRLNFEIIRKSYVLCMFKAVYELL